MGRLSHTTGLATDHNNKDKTKKQTDRGKEKLRKGQQGKTMNKWAYKKLHNYKT
jgi:hypothetical protein